MKLTEDGTARSSAQDRPKFVSELLELCANFDISAADYFERHRGEFKDHMDKTKFRKLEEYINKYDLLSITQSEELWR